MPRKRKSSGLEDLLAVAAMLPWWLAVVLAVMAYAVLHYYAGGQAVATPAQPGQLALDHLLKTLATIGQYLVPAVFLLGALVSVLGRRHRQRLVAQVSRSDDGEALRAMVKRVAKTGAHAGREFWGCVSYPKCRGARHLE